MGVIINYTLALLLIAGWWFYSGHLWWNGEISVTKYTLLRLDPPCPAGTIVFDCYKKYLKKYDAQNTFLFSSEIVDIELIDDLFIVQIKDRHVQCAN